MSPTHPGLTAEHEAGSARSILGRLKDLLASNPLPNLAVAVALTIGFYHGWLKLRFPGPITTFAFDIPLILALVMVLPRVKSMGDFFPESRAGRALKAFYGVVFIWFLLALVLPGGAPLLVALAAVRGWVFSTLMFGLGYQIIRSRRQLHGYFMLILLLAAATAIYGAGQSEEEVQALMKLDPEYARRFGGQAFVSADQRWILRRFSTFISSGAFGAAMSATLLFAAALMSDRKIGLLEKALVGGLGLLIGYGMFLSGARSAVIAFGAGLIAILWFRRVPPGLLALLAILGVGLMLGERATGGASVDRLATLDTGTVVGRFWIVWAPGFDFLMRSGFLGGGLGKSLVGLPQFLMPLTSQFEVWGVDGDLGKLMAELGIVGVVVIAWLLWSALRDGYEIVKRHPEDILGTLGLGGFSLFFVCVLTFPTGSPFIGIPLGVLSWFFLGAAIGLDRSDREGALMSAVAVAGRRPSQEGDPARVAPDLRATGSVAVGEPADAPPRPRRNFLYEVRPVPKRENVRIVPKVPSPPPLSKTSPPETPARSARRRRFLYQPPKSK